MNRVLIGLSVGAAAAVGAAGVGLGYFGALSLSRQADATVTTGSLTYYVCPSLGAAGELHHGDRVYVTGVDDTGDWVQVRAPHHLDDRAWIQRDYLDPDDELDVPVATCATEVGRLELAEGPYGATTTTEPDDEPREIDEPGDDPDEPTSTTTPAVQTTVVPTTVPPPLATTTTTVPTTTTAPTTTSTTIPAPTISSVSVSPTPMIRQYTPQPGSCETASASETAVITASGVANASSVTWVAHAQGSQIAAGSLSGSGSTRTGSIGPFAWSDNADPDVLVTVTVTVSGLGGSAQGSTSFTLFNCNIPF